MESGAGAFEAVKDGAFAFVEDAFVSPPILKTVSPDVVEVSAICIYSWNDKKKEFSWRAIRIDAVT
ncbi:MAG: hypothetical protein IPP28_00360 [Xanthomonadales bacterium]|nr:hypothetical protein [Xanthomonadales bacterium]